MRLYSDAKVKGSDVKTCETVERRFCDSCCHIHRGLLTNTTELLIKAAIDPSSTHLDDGLAYNMLRISNTHPDSVWYMIVGDASWYFNHGQIFSFLCEQDCQSCQNPDNPDPWERPESHSSSEANSLANCNNHTQLFFLQRIRI